MTIHKSLCQTLQNVLGKSAWESGWMNICSCINRVRSINDIVFEVITFDRLRGIFRNKDMQKRIEEEQVTFVWCVLESAARPIWVIDLPTGQFLYFRVGALGQFIAFALNLLSSYLPVAGCNLIEFSSEALPGEFTAFVLNLLSSPSCCRWIQSNWLCFWASVLIVQRLFESTLEK